MKEKILYIFLAFMITVSVQAQNYTVTGVVSDRRTKKHIEFASVELISLPDSNMVTGTVTDKRGKFELGTNKPGLYILRSSFVGYEQVDSEVFTLDSNHLKYDLGVMELGNLAENLREVVVTTKKSMIQTGIDRKIYNVEQDILSSSASASDILKNLPSIEVDLDGVVSLRGSADVMILINGKPSPLMGNSRAEVLQQLPANTIERIEVITNPSARFRPDGTSGIINIVLKKSIRHGFNGSATVNIGNKERYNGNVNLNYRPGKFNFFGGYGIRRDTRNRFNNTERYFLDSSDGTLTRYNFQNTDSKGLPTSHIINGGFDYNINDETSMGVSGSLFIRNQSRRELTTYSYFDDQDDLTEKFERHRYIPENDDQNSINFYAQRSIPGKEDHELRLEYSRSIDKETEDNRYKNIYFVPMRPVSYDNTIIKTDENENDLTLDYTYPISEESKVEAGYDGSYNSVDIDNRGEYFDPVSNAFLMDHNRSNRFIYKEGVHAVYATYQKASGKWGYSFGLRAEQVFGKSRLVTLDSVTRNRYFKIYPTLHLAYITGEKSELQLNYSKRVNRPDGDELNPFPESEDPRNLRAGNPNLEPEIIHSVEFGYKWQNNIFSFVPSLYYRHRQHGFTSVTIPLNDTVLLTTEQNLSKDHSGGLEFIMSAKTKLLTLNLSTNLFYNQVDASNLGYGSKKDIVSMSSNMSAGFNISPTSVLQLTTNYRAARLTAQGKSYPSFIMNAGFRQNFFSNKLSLVLAVSDIFESLRQKTRLNTPYFKQLSEGRRDGRIFYIGLSYRFGIMKKEKEEQIEFDENM